MEKFPKKLHEKLQSRKENNSLRNLGDPANLIDFSSNDYLGFAKSKHIFERAQDILRSKNICENGSTGSRLLSGNSLLHEETENFLAAFHQSEAALLFNSGYDANIGFFSAVPQRGDLVFYDESVHASIRDGLRLGMAKSYKFKHNDLKDLQRLVEKNRNKYDGARYQRDPEVYIVTESIFSMDGDSPDLKAFADFCTENNCFLVVDEAHATGVFGKKGEGLVQELGIEKQIFARINTFGKAMGCHGAVILGSRELIGYLINFARSFIYTTALAPHALATILSAYEQLVIPSFEREQLHKNIQFFTSEVKKQNLQPIFIPSSSAIHCCKIPGNENVKSASKLLQTNGFDVRPILSPTVPTEKERLRFCLHSYNSKQEISAVLTTLVTFVAQLPSAS